MGISSAGVDLSRRISKSRVPSSWHPWRTWVVCLALVSLLVSSAVAAPPQLKGQLDESSGLRVLRVWGTPHEQGFAHGYLLAADIKALFDEEVLDPKIIGDVNLYEQRLRGQMLPMFFFTPAEVEELEGMLEGMRAKLGGSGLHLERLNRPLDLKDLKAVNALPDWYTLFCSSFSAWGDLEADGQIITGRNLDFLNLPLLRKTHVTVVYLDPAGDGKAWVSQTWPGVIGVLTAMNEEGVTISLHDSSGPRPQAWGGFRPRILALREAIEKASADTAIKEVQEILRRQPAFVGNNVHVSVPYTGQDTPAAILEYDGALNVGQGVTVREATSKGSDGVEHAVFCTNHYRTRSQPQQCWRYESLAKGIKERVEKKQPIDLATARKLMKDVSVKGTFQTVIFLPNQRSMYVGLADEKRTAAEVEAVHLKLADLLRRPE
jgi:hypothetical protein